MLMLTNKNENNIHIYLVFGIGLIGKAMIKELKSQYTFINEHLEYSWLDPNKQNLNSQVIQEKVISLLSTNDIKIFQSRISVIWSAGSAGFNADKNQLKIEFNNFISLITLTKQLTNKLPTCLFDFHMLSSSGALYEGQRSVTKLSTPAPKRPYAELKLEQEHYLLQANLRSIIRIYRPSSVYGQYSIGSRAGLISTMLFNGVRNSSTEIYGNMDTLRDYIFVNDIARFIVKKCISNKQISSPKIYILASSRPTPIITIKNLIETIIRKPLYLNYHPIPTIFAHNSFMPSALPSDLTITDLETSIRILYEQLHFDI